MRKLLIAATMLLAGCAAAQPRIHGVTAGHKCRPVTPGSFVGEPAASQLGSAILTATHAAVLRWAPPGVMLTMDYREDRVTVRIGDDGLVAAVNCG